MSKKLTTEQFIEKAHAAHGDRYDYSCVEYIDASTKVKIICKEHGDFWQVPNSHAGGSGCPQCGIVKAHAVTTGDVPDFIIKAHDVHGGRYDYSEVKYQRSSSKVKIICRQHGAFMQTPKNHINSHGCPVCSGNTTKTHEQFIGKARGVHGERYDYSRVSLLSNKIKVEIGCSKHGFFSQFPGDHTSSGAGCPKCGNQLSKNEDVIYEHIKALGIEAHQRDRTLIKPLELDIVIPSLKIAIEYNGLIWHSEKYGKGKDYHRDKTQLCGEAGYRLIHIWEDDFNNNPQRELDFITHQLGAASGVRTYARKTQIEEIDRQRANDFLDRWHVQGKGPASIRLGAFHDGVLVAVTTFKSKDGGFELARHATSSPVIGSLGKAVKYFYRSHGGPIVSFCDLSRFSGVSYVAAGFKGAGILEPDYKYLVGGQRKHKFGFRRADIQRKYPEVFDPESTERKMMLLAGVPRIWDCGKIRFEYA